MFYQFLLLSFVIFIAIKAKPCGYCTPCQVCQPQPVCPVQPPCPPITCPEPPPCPPPPPPQPCMPCLHPVIPVPVPVARPVPVPISRPVPVPVPVTNQCCSTCGTSCFVRRKRDLPTEVNLLRNDSISSTSISRTKLYDAVCNNKILRSVMEQNMNSDPNLSERRIQEVAESQFDGHYNIFCVKGEISYSAYTCDFCQHKKDGITCYAFQSSTCA